MNYMFNVEVATHLKNVNEAIFIHNIAYWVFHNKANKQNFNNGYYWTYNTMIAYNELFPFWTYKQIRTIIKNLQSKNILLVSSFNKKKYDQTKWYTLNHSFTKAFYPEIHSKSTNDVKCPNGQMGKISMFTKKSDP